MSNMDQQYLQQLHACLQQISAPTGGTEGIKNATKALNERFFKSPLAVPGLYEILSSSDNPAVRQLAAIELRKRIKAAKQKHWKKLAPPTKNAIKAGLLQLVIKDPAQLTRHAIARVIAEIAEVDLAEKRWPELLSFISTTSASPNPAEREIAVFTLYALLDTVVTTMSEHLPQVFAMFQKTLADPESLEVRVTTVQALGKCAEYIENDETQSIAIFQAMVPGQLQIVNQVVVDGDESSAKKVFDTLETLLLLDTPLLNPSMGALVELLVTLGSNRSIDEELRVMALNSLLWTIKFKKSRLAQLNLAKPIVDALIQIGAEDEPEDPEDDSVARTAYRCLDAIATSLSPQTVFPALYARIQECAANPDPTLRKSSIMALGVAVEGCSLFIQPHMAQVWPFVDNGLKDGDIRVRKAACTSLSMICEFLGEDCAKRHEALMPLVTACLNDPACQRSAMTALDAIVEELDNAVIGLYLHPLMERLLPMLESAPLGTKGTTIGVISSAAYAAKSAFAPYFQTTMQHVTPFLMLKEEGEELEVRGVTQDAIGTFAAAVGKEAFRPYLQDSLKIAFDALNLDSPQMRECSILFFGVLSKVYGEEFVPFLPQIMPPLLASLGQMEDDDESESDATGKAVVGKGFSIDDDEEAEEESGFVDIEDLDEDDEDFFKVHTAVAVEKAVAADAVAEIFESTKQAFVPYLETAVRSLSLLSHHFYDPTRKAAATTLLAFITTLHSIGNPGENKPGLASISLRPEVKKLIGIVVPDVMDVWTTDSETDVVGDIATAFSQCISVVGIGVVAPEQLESMCTYILQIFERKSPCQQDADLVEEASAATGELSEAESAVINCAADLVGSLATALGADFVTAFGQFFPLMLRYVDPAFSPSDRANTIGALAEIVNGLGSAGGQYTEAFLNAALTSVGDPDPEVRSNAAYMLGSVIFWSQADLGPQYLAMLGRLQPLFTVADDAQREKNELARDNAAGAVARMIIKNKDALPLDQVLPVFFGALPLRRDTAEYPKCFKAIYGLIERHDPTAQAHFGHILDVFAHALAPPTPPEQDPTLSEETRARLVDFLRSINQQAPDQLAQKGLAQYL